MMSTSIWELYQQYVLRFESGFFIGKAVAIRLGFLPAGPSLILHTDIYSSSLRFQGRNGPEYETAALEADPNFELHIYIP